MEHGLPCEEEPASPVLLTLISHWKKSRSDFFQCYFLIPNAPSICSVCFCICSCILSNMVLDCST